MFANRYQEQVAVVAGAASGIGQAIARRLLAEGAHVVLLDQALIEPTPGTDIAVVDVGDAIQVQHQFKKIYEKLGRIDAMINCVGIVGSSGINIEYTDLSSFKNTIDINLVGSFLLTREAIKYMLPRRYGRILLLASIAGKEGNPGMCGYVASKAGMIGLVKGVAKEHAESGITINALAPAVIATPMNLGTAPETLKYMTDKIPMQRLGTVEECAAIATWICSTEASFNTGCVFDLSGGRATY